MYVLGTHPSAPEYLAVCTPSNQKENECHSCKILDKPQSNSLYRKLFQWQTNSVSLGGRKNRTHFFNH
jgi:hypothetical protein